ncbi:MAG: PTS sugar transporter subunit IIA [Liquorilactobacillus hordei]|uniref:PTS sugar transporter subunit IIA n=1 Tax=Liquorilactobacillus hordei TaxID=468911 RepID=UPI0039E96294
MVVDLILDKNLFLTHLEAENNLDALGKIADNLYRHHYVEKNYRQAVLEREKEYPTGLPSHWPIVAIPHADYRLVRKTTISVATLSHSVKFHDMGDTNNTLDVDVIIMMAIGQPHGQVEMLQKIVGIIQDDGLRNDIFNAESPDELCQLFNKFFE